MEHWLEMGYIVRTPSHLYKGGMRFLKNGSNAGEGKCLLEMGGRQEWGSWFYNGEMGNF